jgi:hypothetical protein
MSEPSPGQRAVAAFEIDDVFLVGSECQVDPQFNQTELITEVTFQHRVGLEPTIYGQTRVPNDENEAPIHIIRYIVMGEVRFLREGVAASTEEVADSDVFARIKLRFAADYRCPKELTEDQDAIGAFGKNALFHVWSYWRESVHEHTARMRLPRVTIPMMKPRLASGEDSAPRKESREN